MSYNIDTWKTKRLEGLAIPLSALYDGVPANWQPENPRIKDWDSDNPTVEIGLCEDGRIEGELLPDKSIKVSEITMRGESSGTMFHDVIAPALKKSEGHLEAVLVWEGGDSITRLTVSDGDVKMEQVEL